MRLRWTAAWALTAVQVLAARHHLFAGSFGMSSIHGLTLDDNNSMLTVQKTITRRFDNEWLAISYDGKSLYSSGTAGWSSFSIANFTSVSNETQTTPPVANCSQWTGTNIIASRKPPYSVYGSLSCANPPTMIGADGKAKPFESDTYNEKAAVYGMALDPTSNYLYTADWTNGLIWTYKLGSDGASSVVGSVEAPSNVSAPRSIAIHPSGRSMYVVLEGWNAVALYSINSTSHLPIYSKGLYTVIPSNVSASSYGARSASVSIKGSLLWVTAYSRNASLPGYLTVFKLTELGHISELLLQVQTPTAGGRSNIIAACPFQENLVALAEAQSGGVSVWKYVPNPRATLSAPSTIGSSTASAPSKSSASGTPTGSGQSGVVTGTGGMGGGIDSFSSIGGTVKMIASVKIGDGGGACCSEAVWLD